MQSNPYYKCHGHPFDYNCVRIFGVPGFRIIQSARKLVQQGNPCLFLGNGDSKTRTCACDLENHKGTRGPCFIFDQTFSSILVHSFSISHRNILGIVKLEEFKELQMKAFQKPFDPSVGFLLTLQSFNKPDTLSVVIKDNDAFNIPILHHDLLRHHGEF